MASFKQVNDTDLLKKKKNHPDCSVGCGLFGVRTNWQMVELSWQEMTVAWTRVISS